MAELSKTDPERWERLREEARRQVTPPASERVWIGATLWPFTRRERKAGA